MAKKYGHQCCDLKSQPSGQKPNITTSELPLPLDYGIITHYTIDQIFTVLTRLYT